MRWNDENEKELIWSSLHDARSSVVNSSPVHRSSNNREISIMFYMLHGDRDLCGALISQMSNLASSRM